MVILPLSSSWLTYSCSCFMTSLPGQTLSLRSSGLLAESLFSSQLKFLRARILLPQPVSRQSFVYLTLSSLLANVWGRHPSSQSLIISWGGELGCGEGAQSFTYGPVQMDRQVVGVYSQGAEEPKLKWEHITTLIASLREFVRSTDRKIIATTLSKLKLELDFDSHGISQVQVVLFGFQDAVSMVSCQCFSTHASWP